MRMFFLIIPIDGSEMFRNPVGLIDLRCRSSSSGPSLMGYPYMQRLGILA